MDIPLAPEGRDDERAPCFEAEAVEAARLGTDDLERETLMAIVINCLFTFILVVSLEVYTILFDYVCLLNLRDAINGSKSFIPKPLESEFHK